MGLGAGRDNEGSRAECPARSQVEAAKPWLYFAGSCSCSLEAGLSHEQLLQSLPEVPQHQGVRGRSPFVGRAPYPLAELLLLCRSGYGDRQHPLSWGLTSGTPRVCRDCHVPSAVHHANKAMTSSERQVKTLGTQERGGHSGMDAKVGHFS